MDTVDTTTRLDYLKQQVYDLKAQSATAQTEIKVLGERLHTLLSSLPNVLDADVPDGPDEWSNMVVATYIPPVDKTPEAQQKAWDDYQAAVDAYKTQRVRTRTPL